MIVFDGCISASVTSVKSVGVTNPDLLPVLLILMKMVIAVDYPIGSWFLKPDSTLKNESTVFKGHANIVSEPDQAKLIPYGKDPKF